MTSIVLELDTINQYDQETREARIYKLDARLGESRQVRPVSKLAGIALNADQLRHRWDWPIQNEELLPTGWANTTVWGRNDRICAPDARAQGIAFSLPLHMYTE